MQKTYQSIQYKELHLRINVNNRSHAIDFTGGTTYPKVINGTFQTNDTDIQNALERSPSFNKMYRLMLSEGVSDTVPDSSMPDLKRLEIENAELKATIEAMKQDAARDKAQQTTEEFKAETVKVSGVYNLQQARDYLVNNHGYNKRSLINPATIKKRVEEHNIEFTDFVFE